LGFEYFETVVSESIIVVVLESDHAFCRLQWYVEKGIDVSMVA